MPRDRPARAAGHAHLAGEYEVVLVAGATAASPPTCGHWCASITVIVEQNGKREQGSAGGGGRFDYGYFDDDAAALCGRRCIRRSPTSMRARRRPAR